MTDSVPPIPPPPPPLPPPPPPPSEPSQDENLSPKYQIESGEEEDVKSPAMDAELLTKAATTLETSRALHSEHEAALLFASSLISHPAGLTNEESESLPGGVKDAWLALAQNSTYDDTVFNETGGLILPYSATGEADGNGTNGKNADSQKMAYPLPQGQLGKATKLSALATSLERVADVAEILETRKRDDARICVGALERVSEAMQRAEAEASAREAAGGAMGTSDNAVVTPEWFMNVFYKRVGEIREYHARHDASIPASMEGATTNPAALLPVDGGSALNPRKKRKCGNPIADGYNLHSILDSKLQTIKLGEVYSVEEVMGKYLDLNSFHQNVIASAALNTMFCKALSSFTSNATAPSSGTTQNGGEDTKWTEDKISYPDFLSVIGEGLSKSIQESCKLSQRKKYVRLLCGLRDYLLGFLSRVSPLLNVQRDVVSPSLQEFETEWKVKGGISGWECKPAESVMVANGNNSLSSSTSDADSEKTVGLDLKPYGSPEELKDGIGADVLKAELVRLGMKCGGTPLDRAKRLYMTKNTPLDKLPKKLFVKKAMNGNGSKVPNKAISIERETNDKTVSSNTTMEMLDFGGGNQRRVDIARLEVVLTALLDQLRPTLDATTRRAERRLTQTINEKEREMEEEIDGVFSSTLGNDNGNNTEGKDGKDGENDDEVDSDDEEDAPIYNPKGVPLGWDGKPIPYWLFKLHGLNHFYPCEICGNESYRGRRNFEKHFTEAKHAYGMRCLGIPNTKHFHGVVKIEDAQLLWGKLQSSVSQDIFDGAKEEEYEDSHGNVLSRATYEDLARQGLL